jgi:F-type H+-transporting ATPase subunit b
MLESVNAAPASSAFAINAPVLLVSLINFAILALVLKLVFTKVVPIHKWAARRSSEIKAALEQAETVTAQAAASQQELDKKLAGAEKEVQRIHDEARQAAERIQQEGVTGARREADALVARARGEIGMSRDEAIETLRGEYAYLALEAGARVVAGSLNEAAHKRLIEEALKEAEEGK